VASVFALGLVVSPAAHAGEIVVFLSSNRPGDLWQGGQGASLSLGFFQVLSFEAEAARGAVKPSDGRITYFTGTVALCAPFVRGFTPYAGVGVGLFHESYGTDTDVGTLRSTAFGIKVRLAELIVLRVEYRRLNLLGSPPLDLTSRLYVGAGIAF
jgi:hypothetical protein